MGLLKKLGLIAATGVVALGLAGKADAGVIKITNYTSAPGGIGKTTFFCK